MKSLIINGTILLLLFSLSTYDAGAQATERETRLTNAINAKKFTFVAQSAYPMGGRMINITGYYTFTVKGDTVVADLPYFGRSFVAPINPADAGTRFKSTSFTYDVKQKKSRWTIDITPKDASQYRHVYLDVSSDGFATLQVSNINRQPIRFGGYIELEKE